MDKSVKSRITEAAEKKRSGLFNCAQAVVCTYCDRCGLTPEDAAAVSVSFGSGMGNMEGTCGALVGAGIVLGLVTRDRNTARSRMKTIMDKFQARNGATQCKSLKGVGTGVILRDCPDCVADAAEFLEEYL
ncbi:MAG: C_GCAxxG_C_C family protein [Bacteroidales bacterium]|nr:C_GCAxxG_C_C family protein [Bacteroidales bacterium]